ncbi:class I SAM-dependent methyltransferase [Virgisporangium ochraceum]|uniref:Methyltransferase n=1 Tax=Virgisporangium ochraceum TaxID=65505 RepID=A0A8J4EHM0_9ACTN|nr:class I SAM-dependent methyltransferase [Virgisporangium ochraceum]GIJ72342.1 methyltransferase [Virgisporangium ochraceum]
MDIDTGVNHAAWTAVSEKYWREYDELLVLARDGFSLVDVEREVLTPLLARGPEVVHLQSGDGIDDHALVKAGARSVVGVDYSSGAAAAAAKRATDLGAPISYVVATIPDTTLPDGCADLVYTGKGALIWMTDLDAWAREVARLLRPGGHLWVYDGHPAFALWSWDLDEARIRPDRRYFMRSYPCDSYPANGAVEYQWNLGQIVNAVVAAGLPIRHLGEHPEPFWKMGEMEAAAWQGHLPNTFSLLAGPR